MHLAFRTGLRLNPRPLWAERLRGAYAEAGLPDVILALEPQAAGTRFAATLADPAIVVIGDFGGGTSDFSAPHFDPHRAARR